MTAHDAWAYTRGCRCDTCRDAHSAYKRTLRARLAAERVAVRGRLVAVRPGLCHGVAHTYRLWKCRCLPCSVANSEQRRTT